LKKKNKGGVRGALLPRKVTSVLEKERKGEKDAVTSLPKTFEKKADY